MMMRMIAVIMLVWAFSLMPALAVEATTPVPAITADADLCLPLIRSVEQQQRLPTFLLQAIAHAESGRYDRASKQTKPWPWTVTSGKDSWYLNSKSEAIAQVKKLQQQGVRNIDVGCMQVNLQFHGKHFASLDEALDPHTNINYAATFLKNLRQKHRSWLQATKHYHSATPEKHFAYRKRVYDWRSRLRRADFVARKQARDIQLASLNVRP